MSEIALALWQRLIAKDGPLNPPDNRPRHYSWDQPVEKPLLAPDISTLNAHFAATERTFGQALPPGLRFSFQLQKPLFALTLPLPGIHQWFSLASALRQWRVATCCTYELRDAAQAGFQPESAVQATQTVRHDAWNRGWLPLAETRAHRNQLCLDMAPGPAGTVGQIIEVPTFYPGGEMHVGGSRNQLVATCFEEFLTRLLEAMDHELVTYNQGAGQWQRASDGKDFQLPWLRVQPSQWRVNQLPWQHTGVKPPAAVVPAFQEPGPMFDFVQHAAALATDYPAAPYLDQEGLLLTAERLNSAIEHGFAQPGLLAVAQAWANNAHSPPHWLLLGAAGSGKTALLRALARSLHEARLKGEGGSTPWPIYLDLAPHNDASSLEAALDAHLLALTGLALQGQSVLRAAHLGQCLLLLDNAHVWVRLGKPLWAWCRQLLSPAAPRQAKLSGGARVLLSCDDGAFTHRQDAVVAAQALNPVWANASQQSRLMFLLGGSSQEVPIEDWLAALNDDDAAKAVLAEANMSNQRSELYRSAGWLRMATMAGVRAECRWQKLDAFSQMQWHAWQLWQPTRGVAPLELRPAEVETVAEELALLMRDASRQDGHFGPSVEPLELRAVVAGLRAEWADEALTRACIDACLSLPLLRIKDDAFRFQFDHLIPFFVARRLSKLLASDDEAAFGQAVRRLRPPDDQDAAWLMRVCEDAGQVVPPAAIQRLLSQPQAPALTLNLLQLALCWVRPHHVWSDDESDRVVSAQLLNALFPQAPAHLHLQGLDLRFLDAYCLQCQALPFAGADLSEARLDGCQLPGIDLTGASLRDASAEGTNFSAALADGINATGLRAARSVWRGARLQDAVFDNAKLGGAELTDLQATELQAAGARFEHAQTDEHALQLLARTATTDSPPPTLASHWQPHRPVWSHLPTGLPSCMALSADESVVAVGRADGSLDIWDAQSLVRLGHLIGRFGAVNALAFSNDHQHLVSGHADGSVQVWCARTGAALARWMAHRGAVSCLAIERAGEWLCSGGVDGHVKRWRLRSGEPGGSTDALGSAVVGMLMVEVGPDVDQQMLVFASAKEGVWRFVCASSEIDLMTPATGFEITHLSADESRIWMHQWSEAQGNTHLQGLDDRGWLPVTQGRGHSRFLMSPCARWMLSQEGDGEQARFLTFPDAPKPGKRVADVAVATTVFTQDGDSFITAWGSSLTRWQCRPLLAGATAGDGGRALVKTRLGVLACGTRAVFAHNWRWKVIDLRSGDTLHAPMCAMGNGPDMIGSADGSELILAENSLHAQHIESKQLRTIANLPAEACFVAASARPDEWLVVTTGFSRDLVWVSGGQAKTLGTMDGVRRFLRMNDLPLLAIAPEAAEVVAYQPEARTVGQWAVRAGAPLLRTVAADLDATALAYSADGQMIAIGTADGELRIHRADNGTELRRQRVHTGSVCALAFVCDNSRVVSFGDCGDNEARIWGVADGQLKVSLPWDVTPPATLCLTPTGDLLAAGAVLVCVEAQALAADHLVENWWRYQVAPGIQLPSVVRSAGLA